MMDQISAWLMSIPMGLRVICFLLLVILQVILAIIPGEPFELAAGYVFGFWQGTLWCLIGSAIGTSIIYWLVQRWGKVVIERIFSEETIAKGEKVMNHPTSKYGWIFIYMIPGVPKDIICYLAPLFQIPFIPWLCISTIGRIPSIITSTGLMNYIMEGQWFYVVAMLVLIGIMALVGTIVQKKLESHHGGKEK